MGMLLRHHKINDKGEQSVKQAVPEIKPEKVATDTTTETKPEKKTYTRSQIQLMSVAGLKEVAKEYGISDYENKSGAKLKKELLTVMGL